MQPRGRVCARNSQWSSALTVFLSAATRLLMDSGNIFLTDFLGFVPTHFMFGSAHLVYVLRLSFPSSRWFKIGR